MADAPLERLLCVAYLPAGGFIGQGKAGRSSHSDTSRFSPWGVPYYVDSNLDSTDLTFSRAPPPTSTR